MSMFRKAERKKARARLAFIGVSGSGKTFSSLHVARGLAGLSGRIAVIDTENGSADLYAGQTEFDVCTLEPPYTPQKYLEAINGAEREGYDVIIIDSLSHAWSGEGGLLDMQGKLADRGNGFAAWRKVTPWHNKLVDAIIHSKSHVIATMRAKAAYEVVDDAKGKKAPKKIGLAPVQRDGVEYEFTVVLDIDMSHNATTSKDRTGLFDGEIFQPSQATGEKLRAWLESGKDVPKPAPKEDPRKVGNDVPMPINGTEPVDMERVKAISHGYLDLLGNKPHAQNAMKKVVGKKKVTDWTEDDFTALEDDLHRRIDEAKNGTSMRDEVERQITPETVPPEREPGEEG